MIAGVPLNCFAWELNVPVVTAVMTVSWNDFGIPIRFSWRTRLEISWPFTIDPSTATPATAPSSRLVLVADAAMPECWAGRAERAVEVTGTIAIPNPAPAIGSVQPRVDRPELGVRTTSVKMMPMPCEHTADSHRQSSGLTRATQRPANSEAMIIAAAIGTKSSAVP